MAIDIWFIINGHDSLHMHLIVANYYTPVWLFKGLHFLCLVSFKPFAEVINIPLAWSWLEQIHAILLNTIRARKMSSHRRRTAAKKISYHTFNETGEITEAAGVEQEQLLADTMGDELPRDSQHTMDSIDQQNVQCLVSLQDHLTTKRH